MLAATEAVAPALEIVDSRIRDWRITLVDTVADDASSAGLVCGPWTPLDEAPDLAAVTAGLLIDGRGVAAGTGKEVLGHPAAAVAWLADTLASFGAALEPGHLGPARHHDRGALRRGRPACRGAVRRTRRGVGDVRLIRGIRARRRTPVRSGRRDARRTVGTGRTVEAGRNAR
ncbi:hypothetical protein [Streptomyces sp. NPDC048252]|uniref:hypothetical protein n=1 Tax=Streptomyces sp. NPDC048252 TaxID=3154612 RepID=UPI0034205998